MSPEDLSAPPTDLSAPPADLIEILHRVTGLEHAELRKLRDQAAASGQTFDRVLVGRGAEEDQVLTAFAEAGETGVLRWQIERALPKAEKAGEGGSGRNRAWNTALLYGRLGDTKEAFRWLEEAVRRRDGFVIHAKVHPWLDSLRSDARYDELEEDEPWVVRVLPS